MPSTSVQMTSSSASMTWAMMAPEKSELLRPSVAERVAGEDELRRRDGDGGDSQFFERSGEQAGAEAFAKRSEPVEKFGAGGNKALNGNFMKKVAAEELQLAANAKVMVLSQVQIVQDVKMEIQNDSGFLARTSELAIGKGVGDGEQMIGDALHGGNDHGNTR